jgi:hypothetical protein
MTPEDEEFARLEREAQMRVRQIDEDFEREYAKWEHSPKHQMFKLMDELALARVLIRELGDRLAKLEKGKEPLTCPICNATAYPYPKCGCVFYKEKNT